MMLVVVMVSPQYYWRNYKTELSEPLYYIYRKSLDEGMIPSAMKDAIICPIDKQGWKMIARNCPVALTSHLIK